MVSWHRTALMERDGGRREYEAPRVDKPAQVGTARSVNAAALDEARRLVLSLRVSSSAAASSHPSPRSTP